MKRRTFLESALVAAGLAGGPTLGRARAARPTSPTNLDRLRDRLHEWSEGLWDPAAGGFRESAKAGVDLMTTTDIAWLRYATNDADLDGGHREPWIRFLQRAQDPRTGIVRYVSGPQDSDGHALWQTVRALNLLGGQLLHFPHHLRPLLTGSGLAAWFDGQDWDSRSAHHHEVLGLFPLLANLRDAGWTETFFRKIAAQQNPATGAFPSSRFNISRTFAYSALHCAVGRLPPHPTKIIDAMLSLQKDSGFWEPEPQFHTMDAAYVLVRLPKRARHREPDARRALSRLAEALPSYFDQHEASCLGKPHRMLAIAHTFGLLQEAFPERFPSRRPYRFDWDLPALYRCDVIAKGAS